MKEINNSNYRNYIKNLLKKNSLNIEYLLNLRSINNNKLNSLLIKLENKEKILIEDIYLIIEAEELFSLNNDNKVYKKFIINGIYNIEKYNNFQLKSESQKKELLYFNLYIDPLNIILFKIKKLLNNNYNIDILKFN